MSNMRVTHMLYTDEATPAFIFTCKTTTPTETFALPLEASGTYNFTVDWGDTNTDTITAWDQAEVTHTYASAGTYTVVIRGVITGWRFAYNTYRNKIYDVIEWGPLRLGNNTRYFSGCNNLTVSATDNLDLTGTTTLDRAFELCYALTNVPSMNSWDVSGVTDMWQTFQGSWTFDQDISSWDVSNVTTMFQMFASTPFNQDISSWNVSNVLDMDGMFSDNSKFNQDISSWNVSNVINFEDMFLNAIKFNQNISSWNVSSGTHFGGMFNGATLFNQNIGIWNVSSATNMNSMFSYTDNFNQNIGIWNVSSVTDMYAMFEEAIVFNQDISAWNTSSVIDMESMFWGATNFEQNLASWDITSVTNMKNMFRSITLLTANYDALLVGWEAQVEQPNVTFHGGNSKYSAGAAATARAALQANGWVITDGGLV